MAKRVADSGKRQPTLIKTNLKKELKKATANLVICSKCKGTGINASTLEDCEKCDGDGFIEKEN